MNFKALATTATSVVGRQALKFQKHSPTIMFAGGIVGVVATVVLSSKATLQLEAIAEDAKNKLDAANSLHDSKHPDYSEQDFQNDRVIVFAQAGVKVVKIYAPALVVGILSVAALTGAHVTLNRRNVAVTAAYAALDKGFREYQERVIDVVGPEKELEYRYGVASEEVETIDAKGKKRTTVVKSAAGGSPYARFFDARNQNWSPTAEYNLFFLKGHQNTLNDRLRVRGWITLNDAYDALGMDRTKAGLVMGWVLDGKGDNFVDFGIWDDQNMERVHNFMTGAEGQLLIDFNVCHIFDQV